MRLLQILFFGAALLRCAAAEPPDSILANGIPPIPQIVVDRAAPYLESRAAAFWDWHPLRREILIGTRFGETMQIHQVKFPSGARNQLSFLNEPVAGALFRPNTAEYIVYQQDKGGGEFFQLYRMDAEDGRSTLLTDGASRNIMGPFSNAGDRIAYTSTRRNGKDTDIYVVDPANPTSTRMVLQVTGGGWSVQDWSPDDKQLLLLNEISINESYLHLLDLNSGAPQLLNSSPGQKGEKISFAGGEFAKDGKSIYFTTDRDSQFHRLVRLDVGTMDPGMYSLTSRIPWDITQFDLSPDGKTIAIVSNEDGLSVLRFIDAKTGRDKSMPKLPAGVISGLKWHPKNAEVAFSFSSAQAPADVYTVSLKKPELERWTTSETGGLDAEKFITPNIVKMRSFDGLEISAFVYYPDPAKFRGKRPALILIHGGPESQSLPRFMGRDNFFLNEMGVALVVPNVRGSSGYGKAYLTLDNSLRREDSVRDIGTIINWIQKSPALDPERIAVMGGSYGGYMTLASMTHFSDRLRCGIDIVGISNFITFLEHTQEYRRDLRRAEYGDERVLQIREYLEKTAPINNVKQITKPMLVIQGKNDPRVPMSEAEQMVQALRANKIETWYLLAKDEGHGFKKKRNIDYQFYVTLLFLDRFLME
jgi:dipeptidyl aminopeptidase/acylaminoacyl peptidase